MAKPTHSSFLALRIICTIGTTVYRGCLLTSCTCTSESVATFEGERYCLGLDKVPVGRVGPESPDKEDAANRKPGIAAGSLRALKGPGITGHL
jgi:hypothetical protein